MPSSTITVGDMIYDVTVHFTKITEYGVSLMAALSRQAPVPLAGARADVAFEGVSRGPRIKGKVTGTDYLYLRADGHNDIHIHGQFETDAGTVAFFAQGVSTPAANGKQFLEAWNVTLSSQCPAYTWVNELPVWTQGVCNIGESEIVVQGYATSEIQMPASPAPSTPPAPSGPSGAKEGG
jgi:hypothetical protein